MVTKELRALERSLGCWATDTGDFWLWWVAYLLDETIKGGSTRDRERIIRLEAKKLLRAQGETYGPRVTDQLERLARLGLGDAMDGAISRHQMR
jgi:hypothetical protein